MILSYEDIYDLWKRKKIRFNPDISPDQIKESSIGLRMGTLASRIISNPGLTIRPALSIPEGVFTTEEIKDHLILNPKELVLIFTKEHIALPANIAANIQGRSSYARYGLAIHITSPHIHPLFSGHITLELYNHSPIKLELAPGDRICQLILSKVTKPLPRKVATRISRYTEQKTPSPQPLDEG